jgi:type VI protein secretion system component VasK
VVTKKQRRARLTRAAAQRRAARRTAREARNRRLWLIAATLTAVIAVAGLVAWIVTYDDDRTSSAGAAFDYDAWSVSVSSDASPNIHRGIP